MECHTDGQAVTLYTASNASRRPWQALGKCPHFSFLVPHSSPPAPQFRSDLLLLSFPVSVHSSLPLVRVQIVVLMRHLLGRYLDMPCRNTP